MTTENIIHISDTHVGSGIARDLALQGLVEHIIATYDPADTTVIHTGDCTEGSIWDFDTRDHSREFKDFVRYMQPLRDAGFTLLIVPGNHDGGLQGVTVDRRIRKKFARAARALMPWARIKPDEHEDGTSYPVSLYIPRVNWVFIALDSTVGQLDRDGFLDLARGNYGSKQRAALSEEATFHSTRSQPRHIATLGHHDPWYKDVTNRLTDAEEFKRLLGELGVKLNFGGHRHQRDRHTSHGVTHLKSHATTRPWKGRYCYSLVKISSTGEWTEELVSYTP